MTNLNSASESAACEVRGKRGATLWGTAVVLGSLLASMGVAQAQTVGQPPQNNGGDDSLTWKGITLYGIVDIGLQFQDHGTPISDYFPPGSNEIIQKNANKSVFGATPSNLSQSRVGLSGKEPLPMMGDWSGVFRMETFFNPQSGDLSDGLKATALNNGRAVGAQISGIDTSVAGQAFQQLYAGFSSPTVGTITFGRQNTLFADAVAKYDPMGAAQAFSLIGFSGTAAGGGDTEDRRLDQSLKYVLSYQGVHAGAEYKFNGADGAAATAYEFQLGGEYAGLSVDGYYLFVKDAVSASALSAGQVGDLAGLGYSVSNSLSGTISDNTTYAIVAMYDFGAPKIYGGFEHIKYADPTDPLAVGYVDEGGYILAAVNDQVGAASTYVNPKNLQIYWGGVKYAFIPSLEATVAYYGIHQNSYAHGADAGCTTNISSGCSGNENVGSAMIDYRFAKRFDFYLGMMYSQVSNGLSNGFLKTSTTATTMGVRFKF
jgi:predicted porin